MKTYLQNSIRYGMAVLAIIFSLQTQAQQSPAATAEGKIGKADVSISYSQPSARGREIMGGLVPYDKVWRTGANKATSIELSADVKVEGETLKAGKYGLFTIPGSIGPEGRESWFARAPGATPFGQQTWTTPGI